MEFDLEKLEFLVLAEIWKKVLFTYVWRLAVNKKYFRQKIKVCIRLSGPPSLPPQYLLKIVRRFQRGFPVWLLYIVSPANKKMIFPSYFSFFLKHIFLCLALWDCCMRVFFIHLQADRLTDERRDRWTDRSFADHLTGLFCAPSLARPSLARDYSLRRSVPKLRWWFWFPTYMQDDFMV